MPLHLEKIGVEAVVEGMPSFTKALDQVGKSVSQAAQSLSKTTAQTQAIDEALADGTKGAVAFSGSMLAVGAAVAVAAVAIGTAISAVAGIIDLALQASSLTGISQSFDAMNRSLETTPDLLHKMEEAAKGAISELRLMQTANLALTGTSGELATKFSEALPKFLELARVQSVATGQAVDYLFNSLVLGIKRSEPRLIDNTGLIIKIGQATKTYADSIGKSADELTAEERQLAVLNETLRVGAIAVETYGNIHETAAIKIQRSQSILENIGNTLGMALQPALEAAMDGINNLLTFFSELAAAAAPYIEALAQMVSDVLGGVFGSISSSLSALNAGDLAKGFFTGGARIIGALAGGMAAAARATVIPVIKAIAQAIASFLSGFSPPPMGPLHTIDIGGANVMYAWLEGFMGVSLEPVSKVAGQVAEMMGSIGTASSQYVEARLADLDRALKPFQDRLAIVKAQFDAMKPAVDAAFSSIDRQMEAAIGALSRGEIGSGAMVRALDTQRTALEDYVDAQQAAIDNSQIQLALAEAAQEPERTMLELRKAQLGVVKDVNQASGGTSKAPAAKKPSGGGGQPSTEGGAPAFEAAAAKAREVANTTGDEMGAAFGEGFAGAGGDIAGLQADIADIGASGASIGTSLSKLGEKINTAFTNAFDPTKIAGGLLTQIQAFADKIIDGIRDWIISDGPRKLTNGFVSALSGIALTIGEQASGVASGIMDGIQKWIATSGPQKLINGLISAFATVALGAASLVVSLASSIGTEIASWIETNGPEKFIDGVTKALSTVAKSASSIVSELSASITIGIANFLSAKGQKDFNDGIDRAVDGIVKWVTGGGLAKLSELGAKLVLGIMKGLDGLVKGIGQSVVDGIEEGIRRAAGLPPKQREIPIIVVPSSEPSTAVPTPPKSFPPPSDWLPKNKIMTDEELGTTSGHLGLNLMNFVIKEINIAAPRVAESLTRAINTAIATATASAIIMAQLLVGAVELIMDTNFPISLGITFQIISDYITTSGMMSMQTAFNTAIDTGPIAYLLSTGDATFINAMSTIVNDMSTWVTTVAAPILTGIGQAITDFIIGPFSKIGEALKHAVAQALRSIAAALRSSGLADFVPEIQGLIDAADAATNALGGAKGGLFGGGLLKVGEKGPELISSASKFAVFPANVTRMLESLTSVMASPMAPGGNYAYNYNNSTMGDVNMYGVSGTGDAVRRYSLLRAMGRVR